MAIIPISSATGQSLRDDLLQKLRMTQRYVTSYYKSSRERALFANVHTYCMFVGHARSGHSIVGALLDAHPNIVLPDEVNVLEYVAAGFNKQQIFYILLARAQRQARRGRIKAGRNGKTYSYFVPGQWQGRSEKICVIGDSTAGKTTQQLAHDPALLARLQRTVEGMNVKIIHVLRNPYDNISTLMMRGARTFENALERYFANCATIAELYQSTSSIDMFTLRQEDLINEPRVTLPHICQFLCVEANAEYVEACASILYRSPARSRFSINWQPQQIEAVAANMEPFPFLHGYSYKD